MIHCPVFKDHIISLIPDFRHNSHPHSFPYPINPLNLTQQVKTLEMNSDNVMPSFYNPGPSVT